MLFKELESSKDRILEWALERVKNSPKVTITIFDEEALDSFGVYSGEFVEVEVDNSVSRELRELISTILHCRYDEYDQHEVAEELVNLLMGGFGNWNTTFKIGADRPICMWSDQEMIDWIWDNAIDHSCDKWEDAVKWRRAFKEE